MATKKITDLVEIISAASGDVLPIVDISDDITKKIQVSNFPISTATQTAIDAKQDTLVSGTNIKTLNSESLLGSGNIEITASPAGVAGAIQFSDGSAFASDAANLFWDDTNKRLGVGTNAPKGRIQIVTDDAVNSQAFSNQTCLLAGTASQGALISAFSSTNGAFLNSLWPGNAWLKFNYGGLNHNFSVAGVVTAVIDSNTTFGNGTTSLGARLGIKGSGSTSATTALLVQNSAGTDMLKVTDNGNLTIKDDVTIGNSNASRIIVFSSTMLIRSSNGITFQTFNGSSFVTAFGIYGTQQNVGIGTASPTAKTHIKGSGTTAATTALLVQNSAGVDMIKITDDITTTIGNQFNIIRTTVPSQLIEINAHFGTLAPVIRAGGNGKDFILSAKDSRDLYLSTNFATNTTQVQFAVKHNIGVLIKDNASTAMDASARLEVASTTQGFLPPRMTTTQKNAISSPASGLMVYDTDTNKLCCYNGTSWNDLF
jgi:hypothetical protein